MGAPAAIMDFYESLPAGPFPDGTIPPIFFHMAPQVNSAGTAVSIPYVVLRHKGTSIEDDYSGNPIYTCRFDLDIYYQKLAECDAAELAIRYGGVEPTTRGGFDQAPAVTMTGYTYLPYSLVSDGPSQQTREETRSPNVLYVHKTTLPYVMQYTLTQAPPTTTASP